MAASAHLQDEAGPCHERVVMQICGRREKEHIWQQLIHTHLLSLHSMACLYQRSMLDCPFHGDFLNKIKRKRLHAQAMRSLACLQIGMWCTHQLSQLGGLLLLWRPEPAQGLSDGHLQGVDACGPRTALRGRTLR